MNPQIDLVYNYDYFLVWSNDYPGSNVHYLSNMQHGRNSQIKEWK